MTAFTEPRTLRVPVELVNLANTLAYVSDPDVGSAESFRIGCAVTEEGPATHFICSVLVTPEMAALLDDPDVTNMHAAMLARSAQTGRTFDVDLSELQALRDASDVSSLSIQGLLAEVGQVLVVTSE